MTAREAAVAANAEDRIAIGSEALAQGLLLVRSATINVVRLQLAMERCDRRAAIETMDEVMRLDRRLDELVGALAPDRLTDEAGAVERQHRALAVERLVLVAGTSGPHLTPVSSHWIDPEPSGAGSSMSEAVPSCIEPDAPEEAHSGHAGLALLLLAALALLCGTAAYLLLTESGRGLVGGWTAISGAG